MAPKRGRAPKTGRRPPPATLRRPPTRTSPLQPPAAVDSTASAPPARRRQFVNVQQAPRLRTEANRSPRSGESISEEVIGASVPAISPMLYEHHFPVGNNNYGQPYINSLSTVLLGLRDTTLSRNKGIKLSPGQTFCYNGGKKPKAGKKKKKIPQKKHHLFLFEAGVNPKHAKSIQDDIHIYVKCKNKDTFPGPILVGTLSAAHPRVPLELTLDEDCELSHSSKRKDVYFNGFRFTLWKSPKLVKGKVVWSRAKSVRLECNKLLWIAEVSPSQELEFNPVDEGKEYHLLEARFKKVICSKEDTNESFTLHSCCNEKIQLLGEPVTGCNPIRLNTVFDDRFTLSHTSDTMVVIFYGYTMPSQPCEFKLKDLNEYTEDPQEDNLKASPKISVDPEYKSYQARLAKGPVATSRQEVNLVAMSPVTVNQVAMSPVTAPVIFGHRPSYPVYICQLP